MCIQFIPPHWTELNETGSPRNSKTCMAITGHWPLYTLFILYWCIPHISWQNTAPYNVCVGDMNKYSYSQPSLSAALFCNFPLNWIAVINTQNSSSASNPRYCDSTFNKISYPVTPSPTTEERRLSLPSPSSPTSYHSSSSLLSVTTITIFRPIQCLRIT